MATQDTCCSVSPYFEIHAGKTAAFRAICEKYVEWSSREPGCLYYGFSFDGDLAHCREGFEHADAHPAMVSMPVLFGKPDLPIQPPLEPSVQGR